MSECESVRGEWGGICPDCGQQMPAPVTGAPSSKSRRVIAWTEGDRRWSEERKARYVAGDHVAGHRPATEGPTVTERMVEVTRLADTRGVSRAARELGVAKATVHKARRIVLARGPRARVLPDLRRSDGRCNVPGCEDLVAPYGGRGRPPAKCTEHIQHRELRRVA